MIKKNGSDIKFELLSEEASRRIREKHQELKEKSKRVRDLCEADGYEIDISQFDGK